MATATGLESVHSNDREVPPLLLTLEKASHVQGSHVKNSQCRTVTKKEKLEMTRVSASRGTRPQRESEDTRPRTAEASAVGEGQGEQREWPLHAGASSTPGGWVKPPPSTRATAAWGGSLQRSVSHFGQHGICSIFKSVKSDVGQP